MFKNSLQSASTESFLRANNATLNTQTQQPSLYVRLFRQRISNATHNSNISENMDNTEQPAITTLALELSLSSDQSNADFENNASESNLNDITASIPLIEKQPIAMQNWGSCDTLAQEWDKPLQLPHPKSSSYTPYNEQILSSNQHSMFGTSPTSITISSPVSATKMFEQSNSTSCQQQSLDLELENLANMKEIDGIILLVDDNCLQMKILLNRVTKLIQPKNQSENFKKTKGQEAWEKAEFVIETRDNWAIICASDGTVALEILKKCPITATITDQSMHKMNGIELITIVRNELIQHESMYLALHTADTMAELTKSLNEKLGEELNVFLETRHVDFIKKQDPLTGLIALLEEKKSAVSLSI
ncbi:hypothetical protein N9Q05_02355 [bacterium]|nr:hypothetical protein [bacterium]